MNSDPLCNPASNSPSDTRDVAQELPSGTSRNFKPPGDGFEECTASNLQDCWFGYYRSRLADKNGRHNANCKLCGIVFQGRKDTCLKHRLDCSKRSQWPTPQIAASHAHKRKAPQAGQKSITKYTKPNEGPIVPDVLARKLLCAIVSSSVPMSIANDFYWKDFFHFAGLKTPYKTQQVQ